MKFINKIPEHDESKYMINDKKTIMHKKYTNKIIISENNKLHTSMLIFNG